MITHDSFKVDLTTDQWHFVKEESPVRIWVNPYQDLMQMRLILAAPPDLPPDYPNMASQRAFFEGQAKQGQYAVIAVDRVTLKGAEGFSTLFKFKNPQNPMGHRILGTMMLTFERFFCGFQFRADEHGTTGEREAAVYIILKSQNKLPPEFAQEPKLPPQRLDSMEEYFAMVRARPPLPHFSDDAQYDELFPHHPISRVRRYMKRIADTLEVDAEVKQARGFRGPAWKPTH